MKRGFKINNIVTFGGYITSSDDLVQLHKIYQALTICKSLLFGPKYIKMNSAHPGWGDHTVQWSLARAVARGYGSSQKCLICSDVWMGARFRKSVLEMDFRKVNKNCVEMPVKLFQAKRTCWAKAR